MLYSKIILRNIAIAAHLLVASSPIFSTENSIDYEIVQKKMDSNKKVYPEIIRSINEDNIESNPKELKKKPSNADTYGAKRTKYVDAQTLCAAESAPNKFDMTELSPNKLAENSLSDVNTFYSASTSITNSTTSIPHYSIKNTKSMGAKIQARTQSTFIETEHFLVTYKPQLSICMLLSFFLPFPLCQRPILDVLFVEDTISICKMVKKMFEMCVNADLVKWDINLTICTSMEKAIAHCETHTPHIVLTDIQMEETDSGRYAGIVLAEYLFNRKIRNHAKGPDYVIAVTSNPGTVTGEDRKFFTDVRLKIADQRDLANLLNNT
ncbi:MAG: hypothetical protein Q8S21_03490 [Candidatus Paracaedibacteraceae bacterium]|nr:hypothetical protein [Candidatus Paracaedibacteraceae bacterium]